MSGKIGARVDFTKANAVNAPTKNSGDFKISPGAVVCTEAQLFGDITIGTHTVVHPTAVILAEDGPIIIGDNNLIMEKAVIINKKPSSDESDAKKTLVIGDGNVFEFCARCESKSIGSDNIFESKSFVGEDVVVSDRCVVGACCSLNGKETIIPGTVVTGHDQKRWIRQNTVTSNQQQLEYLIKLLPNFHRTVKSIPK